MIRGRKKKTLAEVVYRGFRQKGGRPRSRGKNDGLLWMGGGDGIRD